jgi:hypothetical protein
VDASTGGRNAGGLIGMAASDRSGKDLLDERLPRLSHLDHSASGFAEVLWCRADLNSHPGHHGLPESYSAEV